MEPLRPLVDDFALELLRQREFTGSDFFETNEGAVRVMPQLCERDLTGGEGAEPRALRDVAGPPTGRCWHSGSRR